MVAAPHTDAAVRDAPHSRGGAAHGLCRVAYDPLVPLPPGVIQGDGTPAAEGAGLDSEAGAGAGFGAAFALRAAFFFAFFGALFFFATTFFFFFAAAFLAFLPLA